MIAWDPIVVVLALMWTEKHAMIHDDDPIFCQKPDPVMTQYWCGFAVFIAATIISALVIEDCWELGTAISVMSSSSSSISLWF